MCPPVQGGTWVYRWSKLQIQEKWWCVLHVTKVENDWLVPMFWCVGISVSDLPPSTKVCNKQDCRNQVVQFLTNPFLGNFQNGHSPPLYFVGFARCDPKGNPCAPLYRGHMGLQVVKVASPREVVCVLHATKVENDWLVPMFWCVGISVSDLPPQYKGVQ